MKVRAMITKGLVTKFNCKEESLHFCVEDVRGRAEMAGWMDTLFDCITIQVGHATYSVLIEYGKLNMGDITKHASFKVMSHNSPLSAPPIYPHNQY
eukprot:14893378-Ditylum_brightwellii.AAC.1